MMQAIMIAATVLFIHATTWDGMIFSGIKNWIKPEGMLYKPIYGCPICMTPWWGTLIYWVLFHHNLQDYIVTLLTASGFSIISVVLVDIRDAALKYTE